MSARFPGQQIESWNPAIDVRSVEAGRLFILGGKNYLFDSKGPKSGFGHRLVAGGNLGSLSDIQSVDVDKQTILFASNGIYRQEYALPSQADALEPGTWWRKLVSFNESDGLFRFGTSRWSGAYVNGSTFVGEVNRGLFVVNRLTAELHTADGVPSEPIAVLTQSSRLVVVTPTIFAWSNTGDGYDFVPQTGGAGFQKLIQYLAGKPVAVTSSNRQVVVWTRDSAMIAEFIGGQAVFRFDSLEGQLFPLGPMAVTQDSYNRAFMMTRHGVMRVSNATDMEELTPTFNQMFREFLNDNPYVTVRLDYLLENDLLFIQVADSSLYYQQTFVLSVRLDKWGSFDEEHLGICRFGEQQGLTGYADLEGYIHKFTDTPDREMRGSGLKGLDSYIDIGYLNDPQMIVEADTSIEMQELMISARESFPANQADLQLIDWMGVGDYFGVETGTFVNEDWNDASQLPAYDEDWNIGDDSEVIDDDLNNLGEDEVFDDTLNMEGEEATPFGEDFNLPGIPEDWNLDAIAGRAIDWNLLTVDDSEDWNYPPLISGLTPDPLTYEDWMNTSLSDEDWNGPYSFLNFITYDLQILSSMNGFEYELSIVPELAIEHMNRDLWTMLSSGRFQTVRLTASERWQRFHVTQLDASMNYYGHYS